MAVDKNHYLPSYQEEFTVRSYDAIVMLLLGLARKSVTLSAAFGSGSELLLTIVLDVIPEENLVILDASANERLNNKLLLSGNVGFFGIYNGAAIQWTSQSVAGAEIDGHRIFRIDIPRVLQYLQRRGSYRVDTPIANPVICSIPIRPELEVVLRLVDICTGGISVILPDHAVPEIHESAEFQDCRIKHSDLGEVAVTLVVRSVWTVTLRNGAKRRHAGLGFVRLRAEAQAMIQRFVYRLERRVIATTRDKIRNAVPGKGPANADPRSQESSGDKSVAPRNRDAAEIPPAPTAGPAAGSGAPGQGLFRLVS